MKQPYLILVLGPTGVGKTDFVDALASHAPVEIINGDMGQMYEPLAIGTAKPDWRSSAVPHHLFDIIQEPHDFTVTQYRNLVLATAHDVWQRGHIPLIVGGSGFYLKSLFYPPQGDVLAQNMQAEQNDSVSDADDLWQQLAELDPERAHKIHSNDMYRIKRALSLIQTTGKKASQLVPTFDFPFPFHVFYLTRERDELYQRINERTLAMINSGWIAEVEAVLGTPWEEFLMKKRLIGYPEIIAYLNGLYAHHDKDYMIEQIQQKTRNYAKRQNTFWRSLHEQLATSLVNHSDRNYAAASSLTSVNLTLLDLTLYIKQLSEKLIDNTFAQKEKL